MIIAEDDQFHPRNDDPYWNESSAVIFMIPERNIKGVVYYYHRPNMKLSAGGPFLWSGDGEEIHDCLYWGFNPLMPLPETAEMNDFVLDNGLQVRTLKSQESLQLMYKSSGLDLDLTFDAIMPPQEMMGLNKKIKEANPTAAEWLLADTGDALRTGHYDQAGRVQGTVRLGTETLPVDCLAYRDHTWGPRSLVNDWPRGAYHSAVASSASSFLMTAVTQEMGERDPVVGTTEQVVAGWYAKDGVISRLVSGERRCVERRPDGRAHREVLQATDELGRVLQAEGSVVSGLNWTGYRNCLTWWSLAQWHFDGHEAWGEICEYIPFDVNARFGRTLSAST